MLVGQIVERIESDAGNIGLDERGLDLNVFGDDLDVASVKIDASYIHLVDEVDDEVKQASLVITVDAKILKRHH